MLAPRDRLDHPAARAWQAHCRHGREPSRIQDLKYGVIDGLHKSHVFRLAGAGPRGESIVAKLCPASSARLEQTIYTQVLPQLPLPALRSHGIAASGSAGMDWLFLEDAGAEPPAAGWREPLVDWLARLHATPELAAPTALPERGAPHYRRHRESARAQIAAARSNAALSGPDHAALDRVERQLQRAEERWEEIAAACAAVPPALVHGDLVAKNLRLRPRPGAAPAPIVFDWEVAGRGSPAPDLFEAGVGASPDLARAYCTALAARGIACSEPDVARASRAGRVLRLIASIDWSCASLALPWIEKAMGCLAKYGPRLEDALGDPGWRR